MGEAWLLCAGGREGGVVVLSLSLKIGGFGVPESGS